jgi:hypothetical protein
LTEVVDEQGVECGIMLMQPSQESQDDTDAIESPFVSSNETMVNVELVSGSVGVGDVATDVRMILGVDHQPIATVIILTSDASSVVPEFMPEYIVVFGDERRTQPTIIYF